MRAMIRTALNRHADDDCSFVESRPAARTDRNRLVVAKRANRSWRVHFLLEGDGMTRCGRAACDMCVQPDAAPRLLQLRACRLCAARVTAQAVRGLGHRHDLQSAPAA
jgi:hypothetical protein